MTELNGEYEKIAAETARRKLADSIYQELSLLMTPPKGELAERLIKSIDSLGGLDGVDGILRGIEKRLTSDIADLDESWLPENLRHSKK